MKSTEQVQMGVGMIRAIMHGCNGRMGQVIAGLIKEDTQIELVAGIDVSQHLTNPFPVFSKVEDCNVEADVIIDFASAVAVEDLLRFAADKQIPVVLCTTGLSEEQLQLVEETTKKVAILKSANMSLGVNLLMKLLKDAAKVLVAADFDIEIVEKHHNKKVDAPSGTALALADAINEEFQMSYDYRFDRSQDREQRPKKEIGISAVRGGTIVGEHDVIFAGNDEVITFNHTAYSKGVFAKGAIQAAKYLAGKKLGLYNMHDVIEGQN